MVRRLRACGRRNSAAGKAVRRVAMSKARDTLPHYEYEPFNNAALELCLVQVRYPVLPRFAEAGYLSNIQEALSEEYPLFGSEQSMNIVVTPQGVSQAASG